MSERRRRNKEEGGTSNKIGVKDRETDIQTRFHASDITYSTERTTASSLLVSSLASRSYGLISAQTERIDKKPKRENTKARLSLLFHLAAAVTVTAYQQIAGAA